MAKSRGGQPIVFHFSYDALQELTGLSYDAVKQQKSRGAINGGFDAGDDGELTAARMLTVVHWVIRNGTEYTRQVAMAALVDRGLPKRRASSVPKKPRQGGAS